MGDFPLPNSPRTWQLALLTIVYAFIFYYLSFFPRLNVAYHQGFWWTEEVNHPVPAQNQSGKSSEVIVSTSFPRYVTSFVEREMYVNIRNPTDTPLKMSVVVQQKTPDKGLYELLFSVQPNYPGASDTFPTTNQTLTLAGHDSRSLTYLLRASAIQKNESSKPPTYVVDDRLQGNPLYGNIEIWINGARVNLKQPNIIMASGWKSLLDSFIKVLLLPPWSNGLLVLGVMALIWYLDADRIIATRKNEKTGQNELETANQNSSLCVLVPTRREMGVGFEKFLGILTLFTITSVFIVVSFQLLLGFIYWLNFLAPGAKRAAVTSIVIFIVLLLIWLQIAKYYYQQIDARMDRPASSEKTGQARTEPSQAKQELGLSSISLEQLRQLFATQQLSQLAPRLGELDQTLKDQLKELNANLENRFGALSVDLREFAFVQALNSAPDKRTLGDFDFYLTLQKEPKLLERGIRMALGETIANLQSSDLDLSRLSPTLKGELCELALDCPLLEFNDHIPVLNQLVSTSDPVIDGVLKAKAKNEDPEADNILGWMIKNSERFDLLLELANLLPHLTRDQWLKCLIKLPTEEYAGLTPILIEEFFDRAHQALDADQESVVKILAMEGAQGLATIRKMLEVGKPAWFVDADFALRFIESELVHVPSDVDFIQTLQQISKEWRSTRRRSDLSAVQSRGFKAIVRTNWDRMENIRLADLPDSIRPRVSKIMLIT